MLLIMAGHSAQVSLKVMLHGTIRNDIVSNSYNIAPALQRCVALKIVVTNRPVYNHLYSGSKSFDSLTVVYLLNTPCPNKQDSSITGDDLEKKTEHFIVCEPKWCLAIETCTKSGTEKLTAQIQPYTKQQAEARNTKNNDLSNLVPRVRQTFRDL